MTKDVGILVLGLLVAAMPFLGFPGSIEQIIFIVSGLTIAALAFFIRGEQGKGGANTESYVQNGSSGGNVDGIRERENGTNHGEESKKKE